MLYTILLRVLRQIKGVIHSFVELLIEAVLCVQCCITTASRAIAHSSTMFHASSVPFAHIISLFTILHPSPVYPPAKISSFPVLKLAVIAVTEVHKRHNLHFTVKTQRPRLFFFCVPQWTLDKTDTELLHSHDSLLSRILGKIDGEGYEESTSNYLITEEIHYVVQFPQLPNT